MGYGKHFKNLKSKRNILGLDLQHFNIKLSRVNTNTVCDFIYLKLEHTILL